MPAVASFRNFACSIFCPECRLVHAYLIAPEMRFTRGDELSNGPRTSDETDQDADIKLCSKKFVVLERNFRATAFKE